MTLFEPIFYEDLKSREKENYNFHKFAARLADYGYTSMRLSDDWQGADFIAYHSRKQTFLRVQLKGRATLSNKYEGNDIYIAFRDGEDFYVYPHDTFRDSVLAAGKINSSVSWDTHQSYSWPGIPAWMRPLLADYRI